MHSAPLSADIYSYGLIIAGSTSSAPYRGSGNDGSASSRTHRKIVVCYIQSCAVYRPGEGSFTLDGFDSKLCTHAIYSFVGLDELNDNIKFLGVYKQFLSPLATNLEILSHILMPHQIPITIRCLP